VAVCTLSCVIRHRIRVTMKLLSYFVDLILKYVSCWKLVVIRLTKQQIRRLDPPLFKENQTIEHSFIVRRTSYGVLELPLVLPSLFGIERSFVTLLSTLVHYFKNILFLLLYFFALSLFTLIPFLSHFADDKNPLQLSLKVKRVTVTCTSLEIAFRHCNFVLHDLYTVPCAPTWCCLDCLKHHRVGEVAARARRIGPRVMFVLIRNVCFGSTSTRW
jgi:hypothetical protein